jgi:hypothetical protein
MENAKDSVLVMKVVLDADDTVELTTGGALHDLAGVLRIRERRTNGATSTNGDKSIGSIVYVAESGNNGAASPGKFQINVAMAADKFAMLLRVANAGRLPAKFMIDAGARADRHEAKALGYKMRAGARVKIWDNHAHRILPITNFVMILPIDVPSIPEGAVTPAHPAATEALATNAQVAELMDDMLVFQSDTRHTMFGLVCVLAIVALAALAIGLAIFFR